MSTKTETKLPNLFPGAWEEGTVVTGHPHGPVLVRGLSPELASLFAASPDLLEALRMWDLWDSKVSSARVNGGSIHTAADFAEMKEVARSLTRAAIAKASGKA